MVVENQPEPEGGIQNFFGYVRENLVYPEKARQAGIEGKVFVQFVVDTDGSLDEVKVIKGLSPECDESVVKLMENAPAWNPGTQRGRAVKVRMVRPVTFKLGDTDSSNK